MRSARFVDVHTIFGKCQLRFQLGHVRMRFLTGQAHAYSPPMSLGPMALEGGNQEVFLGRDLMTRSDVSDAISKQIDEQFINSSYATRSGPESMVAVEMAGEIADVELIVNSILLSVFFTILLVSSNTLAQSIRERTSDIGVLKCLGYKDNTIFFAVILEAVTICFSAVLLGLLATAFIIPAIEIMSGGMLEDTVSISIEIVLGGFLIGLLIAFMSAAVPAYQALRLRVVDALREG